MIELGSTINTGTQWQEIEQQWELSKMDDTSGDVNPYRELIVNNAKRVETVLSQMEQWSIMGNVINYIQYDKHPMNYHSLTISAVNKEKCKRNSYIKEDKETC